MTDSDVVYFTVADERYFVGVVALVNSLRLTGHHERIIVGDLGLSAGQRSQLAATCAFLDLRSMKRSPYLTKTAVKEVDHRGVVVIIDTDILVTGSLASLLAEARAGRICVMRDNEHGRWYPEWPALLGLRAPLRRETYVNSGFVALSNVMNPEFLSRWDALCELVGRQLGAQRPKDSPLSLVDQDALNALLMSEMAPATAHVLPHSSAPGEYDMRARVMVLDERRLMCTFDGRPTLLLHWWGRPKPWAPKPWRGIRRDAYGRLLRRVMVGPDLVVAPEPRSVPIWLRRDTLGAAAYWTHVALGWVRGGVQRLRRRVRRVRSGVGRTSSVAEDT